MSGMVTGTNGAAAAGSRRTWMAVLARASGDELAAVIEAFGGPPSHTMLKSPEVGTVMVEGRAGGTGTRFNLGEATVTRCVARLESGALGVAYALGSDKRKALLAAILDGMLQERVATSQLHAAVEILAARQAEARRARSEKAAATRVEFFTMARGNAS